MKNWTIGKRLLAGFATVIAIVLGLGVVMWLTTNSVSRSVTTIVTQDIPQLITLSDIRFDVTLLRVTNLKHVNTTEAAQKTEIEKEAGSLEKELDDLVAKCEKQITRADQRGTFEKIPPLLQGYQAAGAKLREASRQNKAEEVQAMLLAAGKAGNDLVKTADALSEQTAQSVAVAGRSTCAMLAHSLLTLAVVVLAAVLASLGIVFLISRSVSGVLHRTIADMSGGAEQTAAAAGQVSTASQALAEGASEQAASLEETSSSLEEMASMTKRNSENAEKATTLARHAREAADSGAADMQTMNAAMEAIRNSSDDIAKIIKTIDEIAFQTNILALNAAVEAARAGEAGMGFAVVADEVRSLAQRCAQSAKETSVKIEAAISKTSQGVEISAKVTKSLQEIVGKVRQVDELVAEVASASKEQSQGIDQVNTAIGQMDKVTQANAASAEESASAAEELNAQTESLKDSVRHLSLLVGGDAASASPAHLATPAGPTFASTKPARRNSAPVRSGPASTPAWRSIPETAAEESAATARIPRLESAAAGKNGFVDIPLPPAQG
jgi:methyl-accepting chemotaxis protein